MRSVVLEGVILDVPVWAELSNAKLSPIADGAGWSICGATGSGAPSSLSTPPATARSSSTDSAACSPSIRSRREATRRSSGAKG